MFLNLSKKFTDSIRFKFIVLIALTIFTSVIAVCGVIYFISAKTFRLEDQKLIEAKSEIFERLYQKENSAELLLEESQRDRNNYISIIRPDGSPVLTHLPEDIEDKDELDWVLKNTRNDIRSGWNVVLLEAGEPHLDYDTKVQQFFLERKLFPLVYLLEDDVFESFAKKLPDGNWLVVGKSAEKREEFLMKIRSVALMVFPPFLIASVILGFLLVNRLLTPIQHMIQAIDKIRTGATDARVPLRDSEDELDQLASRFNKLMDSNTTLIANLKTTLDNVAHDLRTPLTRLLNASEDGVSKSSSAEELKEVLSSNIENAQAIKNLLDAIFDLTEAETGTMFLKKEEIDLSELLDQTADLYEYAAEEKKIHLKVRHLDNAFIYADRIRISQVLTNLIDNAFKYSSPGSEILLAATGDSQTGFNISVQDFGIGIPTQELSRIWDRLYRVDSSRSTPGLGIGLSIVKAIVEAHGGYVKVESETGKGSTFIIHFPPVQS